MAFIHHRTAVIGLLALSCTACATSPRQLEALDRGVVAIPAGGGNFVSWRLLAGEDALAFNLYRDGVRLNPAPLRGTSFVVRAWSSWTSRQPPCRSARSKRCTASSTS